MTARRLILAAFLLFLLAAFLLPLVSLSRYHRTIADSLSRSLGHPVHLGSVNLAVFPLPGLVIHDFVVDEDPTFGAEPLLRAPTVTVFPRLSSLWTQRLEISRIRVEDASVNLVRNGSGRWNFSSLLLQASRTATAPTAQRSPGSTPRFPYIEFSSARINFKQGAEKKALSFFNTDASVWLADPSRWRIRLEAQPVRTDLDLDLEDTGTVRLEGSLTRAASLNHIPLNLHAEWTGAQLGQVSRILIGSDSGWRGDLRAEADVTGDMTNLNLHSRLRVDNVHRVEFTPLNEFDLDARCQAVYHHAQQSLDNLTCLLPTGDGHLLLTGSEPSIGHAPPQLNLEINHTPVAYSLDLFGLLRSSLPFDLNASGTINGDFQWQPQTTPTKHPPQHAAAAGNILTGHAVADTVSIHLADVDQPFTFAALRFSTQGASQQRVRMPQVSPLRPGWGPDVILLEPAPINAGAPTPMQLSGQITRSGFNFRITGDASIARLQPALRDVAQLGALAALVPQGSAQADLTFAAPWILPVGSSTPRGQLQGWVRLQHAQFKPAWLPEPIDLADATAQFNNGTITWANSSAAINGIAVKGSVSYVAACNNPAGCPAQINLDFPSLDVTALQSALLGAGRHGEFLQAILSRVESPAPPWPALNGTIHASVLTLGALKLDNASASIAVSDSRLNLLSLDASTLGGSTHVTGSIQAATDGPEYALNLAWTSVKLPELAALFHEKWGTGSIDGQSVLNLHGYSALADSATGNFRWLIHGNWTASPELASLLAAAPQKSKSALWAAAGTISNQTITLNQGPLLGTITFDRKLDLAAQPVHSGKSSNAKTLPTHQPTSITGTLAHPIVATPSRATAAKAPATPRGF